MTKLDLESVLERMRLANGIIWPLPILLDIDKGLAKKIKIGETVAFTDESNHVIGTIEVKDIYKYDKKLIKYKLYNTIDESHPGVKQVDALGSIFVGGKVNLYKNLNLKHGQYNITPKQTRRLFDEKNWSRVVGFHTRNVIHRAHEFIQLAALNKGNCDGLFIASVVGQKKSRL